MPGAPADLLPEPLKLPLYLLDSRQYDADVRDDAAARRCDVRPRGLHEAVAAALA